MTWKERFAAMRARTKVVFGLGFVGVAVVGVLAYFGKTRAALVALAFTLGLFVAGGIMWHEDVQESGHAITHIRACVVHSDGRAPDCEDTHNVLTNEGQVYMQTCAFKSTTNCAQTNATVALITSGGPSSNAQYLAAAYAAIGSTITKPSGNGYADVTNAVITASTVSGTNNCYSNAEKCAHVALTSQASFSGTTTSPAWSATHGMIIVPTANKLLAVFPLNGGAGRTLNNGDTLNVSWDQALQ